MVDGKMRYERRFRQSKVHRNTAPAFFVTFPRSPIGHATALGAKMKSDSFATYINLGRPRNRYPLAFEIVSPQSAVAAANGTIACRRRLGYFAEAPLNGAAVAGTLDHVSPPFRFAAL